MINDFAELERLSRWIAERGDAWALSSRDRYRLELAVTELVTNVLEHDSLDGRAAGIDITMTLRESERRHELTVTLVDSSEPFNPLKADKPAPPSSLEDLPIGGLGIHLALNACERCRYEYSNEKNVLTMIFDVAVDL